MSRVFEDHFCAWSKQKAWSKEKAPPWGHELVGCMLLQSVPWKLSIAPLSSYKGFISVLLGLQVRKILLFFPRVHVMCALCVVTVMLLCWILHALHEDSSDGKNQCPTIDVVLCENCAMGKGCVLEVA